MDDNMAQRAEAPTAEISVIREREGSHGDYVAQSAYAQSLKDLFRASPGWSRTPIPARESLDMIAVKISRILNGNAHEPDHWLDISGYSMLTHGVLTGNRQEKA